MQTKPPSSLFALRRPSTPHDLEREHALAITAFGKPRSLAEVASVAGAVLGELANHSELANDSLWLSGPWASWLANENEILSPPNGPMTLTAFCRPKAPWRGRAPRANLSAALDFAATRVWPGEAQPWANRFSQPPTVPVIAPGPRPQTREPFPDSWSALETINFPGCNDIRVQVVRLDGPGPPPPPALAAHGLLWRLKGARGWASWPGVLMDLALTEARTGMFLGLLEGGAERLFTVTEALWDGWRPLLSMAQLQAELIEPFVAPHLREATAQSVASGSPIDQSQLARSLHRQLMVDLKLNPAQAMPVDLGIVGNAIGLCFVAPVTSSSDALLKALQSCMGELLRTQLFGDRSDGFAILCDLADPKTIGARLMQLHAQRAADLGAGASSVRARFLNDPTKTNAPFDLQIYLEEVGGHIALSPASARTAFVPHVQASASLQEARFLITTNCPPTAWLPTWQAGMAFGLGLPAPSHGWLQSAPWHSLRQPCLAIEALAQLRLELSNKAPHTAARLGEANAACTDLLMRLWLQDAATTLASGPGLEARTIAKREGRRTLGEVLYGDVVLGDAAHHAVVHLVHANEVGIALHDTDLLQRLELETSLANLTRWARVLLSDAAICSLPIHWQAPLALTTALQLWRHGPLRRLLLAQLRNASPHEALGFFGDVMGLLCLARMPLHETNSLSFGPLEQEIYQALHHGPHAHFARQVLREWERHALYNSRAMAWVSAWREAIGHLYSSAAAPLTPSSPPATPVGPQRFRAKKRVSINTIPSFNPAG